MSGFVGVAFLRGINVGGHTVRNDRLREIFEELGYTAVTPFLASGNVIFSATSAGPQELGDVIEAGLRKRLGFGAAAFVRSRAEVVDIAGHDPFGLSEGKMHIAFLDREPTASIQDQVRSLCRAGDRVEFRGTEMFWHVPGSFMDSALSDAGVGRAFENRLTVRTAKTVERIAARMPGIGE